MPAVFIEHINASLSVEVWHFTESEAFFISNLKLSAHDLTTIQNMSLEKRRMERLACRMALQDLSKHMNLSDDLSLLTYTKNGKPIHPNYHLSFSHAGSYAAVALSTNGPVGIDIEQIGSRLRKVYTHFLNNEEMQYCDLNSDQELHYFWGSKEAIYKTNNPVHYQNDITIKPVHDRTGFLHINNQIKTYQIWNQEIDDLCLVVVH